MTKKESGLINNTRNPKYSSLAAIEYHGQAGATQECVEAVMRLIQFNDRITQARILTWSNRHCFLLSINVGDLVAIKSGFTSGYGGEGPRGFSYVLQLLRAHGAEIAEYDVRRDMINRLDASCLTHTDLEKLEQTRPVRPSRLSDYIDDMDWHMEKEGTLWREFPYVIPFAIVDHRIIDLAKSFWHNPDEKLFTGWRRLEDTLRSRTGLDEHGSKLFSRAFLGQDAILKWKGLNGAEQAGRGELFKSAYQVFRNPRAHKETENDEREMLAEFLQLNHLFQLEEEAFKSEKKDEQPQED
jgi:hypothetical protein